MSDYKPEPFQVAQNVDMFIDRELSQVSKYENREPYDEEFMYGLHTLAAAIYALGHGDGKSLADSNASRAHGRAADRDRRAAVEAGA